MKTLGKRKKTPKKTLSERVFSGRFLKTEGPRPLRHPGTARSIQRKKLSQAVRDNIAGTLQKSSDLRS